ncbi:MAG: hypothetical protein ABI564_13280 [Ideonella sp.]
MQARDGLEQAFSISRPQDVADTGILGDSLEQLRGGLQLPQQVVMGLWRRWGGILAHLAIFNGDWTSCFCSSGTLAA